MAEIHVFYHLSSAGQAAALLAGRNAGEEQRIILRSPGHVAPEAPVDVLTRVLKLTEQLPSETTNKDAGLKDVVQGLTATIAVLAQTLDPATMRNVTVEDASPETWELATKLAVTNKDGGSAVAIGYDTEYGGAITGYRVDHDTRRNVFEVKPETKMMPSDRLLTAAEALPLEVARREALVPLLAQANAEAEAQAAAFNAKKAADSARYTLDNARSFLERNSEFAGLPEVIAVQALVDAGDVEGLSKYDHRDSTRPVDLADRAISKLKTEREVQGKKDWVAAHGSEHLRLLVAGDFAHWEADYREERLRFEMPGWKYGSDYPGDRRKPTLGELRLFEEAKKLVPDVSLRWVGDYHKGVYRPGTQFLGQNVYLDRNPVEPGSENDPRVHTEAPA